MAVVVDHGRPNERCSSAVVGPGTSDPASVAASNRQTRTARGGDSFADSVREALAVHYFPGMWAWDRVDRAPAGAEGGGQTPHRSSSATSNGPRGVDDFEPLRVEFDYDARVPDPSGDGDLAAVDGRAVHYQGRADALVVDADRGTHWLLVHRLGPWSDGALLALDETA